MNLFSKLFHKESIPVDQRIIRALFTSARSVMEGASLCLTHIGRVNGSRYFQKEKHSIKRVDRLLGNLSLHGARHAFYQQLANVFVTHPQPLITVDWSSVYNYNFVMLRASLPVQGRAITLYEEVYPNAMHMSHRAHRTFLTNLATVLPPECRPIICTDAGFRVSWFKLVEQHGWHWVGRIRGFMKCQLEGQSQWEPVHHLHLMAKSKPSELPTCYLSKANRFACRAITVKQSPKGRQKLNRQGRVTKCFNNITHAKSAKEPWVLMSNLPEDTYPPHTLVNFYRRRMAMEETFRDNKNTYYGLGLSQSRSRNKERLENLLLIAMLAQVTLYIIGKAAELCTYHRQFQANTAHHRVLSYGYLALRIIQHRDKYPISENTLTLALSELAGEIPHG